MRCARSSGSGAQVRCEIQASNSTCKIVCLGLGLCPPGKRGVFAYAAHSERVPFYKLPRDGTYHWHSYFPSPIRALTCDF